MSGSDVALVNDACIASSTDGDVPRLIVVHSAATTGQERLAKPLARPPWLPSLPVLDLALGALPVVTDDLAARLIIEMAITIADLREEVAAVRAVQSAALTTAHQQQIEIMRLRNRIADLRAQRREA